MKRKLLQLSVAISFILIATIPSMYAQNDSHNKITIAHLQLFAFNNNIEENMQKAELYCRKADSIGADLAVLPEMYSIGCGYDEPAVIEDWLSQAISIDDPFIKHFVALAKELEMAIAVTFLEKENMEYYNSVCVIDRFGEICLKHRKVHLWEPSLVEAVCTSGKEFNVYNLDTKNGTFKLGAMICSDYYFPESGRILMLNGAEIVIVPNAAPLNDHLLAMLKSRAVENSFGVALVNFPGEKECPAYCHTGRSTAYNPWYWGEYQIFEADEKEGIFISEFDLTEIRRYRNESYFGNAFRHPALYKPLTDTIVNEPFKGRKTGLGVDFSENRR
ncbi:MAG: carbon-nitrogen hydrolase family protein [Bacteroides sp.]|nr:carbon-nitrogen hydrolase family protein [Bacteroides sp.]